MKEFMIQIFLLMNFTDKQTRCVADMAVCVWCVVQKSVIYIIQLLLISMQAAQYQYQLNINC